MCCGIRLESKPVSYAWFPTKVGPLYSLPGATIIGVAAEVQDMKWIWEVFRLVISLGL